MCTYLVFNAYVSFFILVVKNQLCLQSYLRFFRNKNSFIFYLFFSFLILSVHPITAKIPTPGNILYGKITIGNKQVLSSDRHIEISVKKGAQTLTSYQIGSLENVGDSYLIKIPFVFETVSIKEGDTVDLYLNQQFIKTWTLREQAHVDSINLEIEKQCKSIQSGYLLAPNNYQASDLFVCNDVTDHFVILDAHTLDWDGNGVLSGSIQVKTGGIFQIKKNSLIQEDQTGNGEVILDGGHFLLQNNYNSTIDANVSKVRVNSSSFLELSEDSKLHIPNILQVSEDSTLELRGNGILQISGEFYLYGILDIKATTPFNLDVRGARMRLASNLNLAQIHFLSNAQTSLTLLEDITITTSKGFTLGSINLDQHALTLGSADSDMTLSQPLVLSHPNERIYTGDADLIFEEHVTINGGSITSTSGNIYFKKGVDLISGTLDVQGGELNIERKVTKEPSFNLITNNTSIPPVAHAGENQESVLQSQQVLLDGSLSSHLGDQPLDFKWEQIIVNAESPVELLNSNQTKASFIAPLLENSNPLILTFQLTVSLQSNPSKTHQARVQITIQPHLLDQAKVDLGVLDAGVYNISETLDFLEVKSSHSLLVQKGVKIYFPLDFIWLIHGILEIKGTKESPIILQAIEMDQPWKGLMVPKTNIQEHTLHHVQILNAQEGIEIVESYNPQLTYFENTEKNKCAPQIESLGILKMNYVDFKDNTTGIKSCFGYPLVIRNSLFKNNQIGILKGGTSKRGAKLYYNQFIENTQKAMSLYPFGWVIENNEISNETSEGIYIMHLPSEVTGESLQLKNNNFTGKQKDHFYLNNQSDASIDASKNYWEVEQTGNMSREIASFIEDKNKNSLNDPDNKVGNVDFSSFLNQQERVSKVSGSSVDINGDGKLEQVDLEKLRVCIVHQQFVKSFGISHERANEGLGIDYDKDCSWAQEDLNEDGKIDGRDLIYLNECIESQTCK